MRATSKLLALALAAVLQPAIAAPAPIELNFEDIISKVDDDGLLDLTKVDYAGVEFKGASWGVTRRGAPCNGETSFSAERGCGAFLLGALGGSSATIYLADGFTSGSSLYYSALAGSGIKLSLYKSLDITDDNLIATLPTTLDSGNCGTTVIFCAWEQLRLDFNGVAKSLVISGKEGAVMLDNLSFAPFAVTDPTRLPEPGALALALSALGALGWARKRAAR